eukprot:351177_1
MKETTELLQHGPNNNMGSIPMASLSISKMIRLADINTRYEYLHWLYATLFYCIANFFSSSISPIANVLQNELEITTSDIGLLSACFFITYWLFQIPFGILLQNYSHHLLLLSIATILSISIFLFGFINNLIFASILRAISGICGCPTWIIQVTIAGTHFTNNKVSFLAGIASVISFVITLIGITLQGIIYQKYKIWRQTYYILGIFGIVIVCCIILTMYLQKKLNEKQKHKTLADMSWMV